uniref:Methyltransf_21 domain-containing protein n=1 Tax=Caenorhabditis tropicalis TaxID=1561998 RepID=A0A1I7TBW6_9PELO
MVTFGIGHDVSAEKKLKEMYSNISFYGADPSTYMNKDLYEKELGGKYFEYAISGQSGRLNSRVFGKGGYREEVTKGIGADDFFADKVQKSKIDFLWIDVEGHEYPILDQLHHKGALDKKGVKICQMNVEMHKDTFKESLGEKKKFHDFVWNVLEDKRFIMLKPVFVIYKEKRFIRTFIVNVSDKECTELFLS